MFTLLFTIFIATLKLQTLYSLTIVDIRWSGLQTFIRVDFEEHTSYVRMQQYCEDTFDTSLASIHSTAEQNEMASSDFDCGFSSPNSDHCKFGLQDLDNNGVYTWIDNTIVDYTNWQSGQPSASGGCVNTHSGGTWVVGTDCNVCSRAFICNAPSLNDQIHIWNDNKSFIWVGPKKLNFINAEQYCQNTFGTSLASIYNNQQNDEAIELCLQYSYDSCMIGLNDIEIEGNLVWSDGGIYNYSLSFNDNDPNENVYGIRYGDGLIGDSPNSWEGPFICNAPKSCESQNKIKHINWNNLLMNDADEIPYYDYNIDINTDNLEIEIDLNLEYLGYSYGGSNNEYGYGTTYSISFSSSNAETIFIYNNSKCNNRILSSFKDKSFNEWWEYSEYPYIEGHIGNDDYLAYPVPGGLWSLNSFNVNDSHKCDRINYHGIFTFNDFYECMNEDNDNSIDIVSDNKFINISSTLYVNIISPLSLTNNTGYYHTFQIINQEFKMSLLKSISLLSSIGVSLYKISIIGLYQNEKNENDFHMILLTESAEYISLKSPNILMSPSGSNVFTINAIDNSECIKLDSYICSQIWSISASNNSCYNISGEFIFEFTAECQNQTIPNCADNQNDSVILSVDSFIYNDNSCNILSSNISATFNGSISFYKNDSFTVPVQDDYEFIVGTDTVYVEAKINIPSNTTYSVLDVSLMNVWLCTTPNGVTLSMSDTDTDTITSSGCLSSNIDTDDYNPYWIIQNYDENFEQSAMHHIDSYNNIVRFSFIVPSTIKREILWIHTQIELSLINDDNNMTIRRILLISGNAKYDTIKHMSDSIITTTDVVSDSTDNEIENKNNNFEINYILYIIVGICLLLIIILIIYIQKNKNKKLLNKVVDDNKQVSVSIQDGFDTK